jgi:putative membrane protein
MNKNHVLRNRIRSGLVIAFIVFNICLTLTYFIKKPWLISLDSILVTIFLFSIAVLHGLERYGWKNLAFFFLVTFAVSFTFENLSVRTGFPFGLYHYSPELGLMQVPLIIIFAYFSMGYLSWMMAHILLSQYQSPLQGIRIFLVPLTASFIMVMWDLTIDPISSTLQGLWVWHEPGAYFGVPISNFFGWFLVVYLFYQIFALYLKWEEQEGYLPAADQMKRSYWYQVPIVYGMMGLGNILSLFYSFNAITLSMSLITVFTMIFVSLLSAARIARDLNP